MKRLNIDNINQVYRNQPIDHSVSDLTRDLPTLFLYFSAILISTPFCFADSVEDAQNALGKAQNNYFNALASGKAKTPEEKEKLRRETVLPAAAHLDQVLNESSKEQNAVRAVLDRTELLKLEKKIRTESGAKTPPVTGSKQGSQKKDVSDPVSAPEPEVKVEGVESKKIIIYGKPSKTTPVTSSAQTPETSVAPSPGKEGMSILSFPGPMPAPK